MNDQVTRTTSQSWFSRIGQSLMGIFFGFILVIAAIIGLAMNESRAVKTANALREGAGSVISLDANGFAPGGGPTRGLLVHAFGQIVVPEGGELIDSNGLPSNVPANATKLERIVEMYQWDEDKHSETREKLGGGTETVTTYSYKKIWSNRPITSARFAEPSGHQNPEMPVQGEEIVKDRRLAVGESDWQLPATLVRRVGHVSDLTLGQDDLRGVRDWLGTYRPVKLSQGAAYVGFDPLSPQVGDLRISYRVAQADSASVVARDASGAFAPWQSSNGREIFLIRTGDVPAAQIFEEELSSNRTLTWILRAAGVLAMLAGFKLMLSIFGVIGSVIPFVGSIVRMGTTLVSVALTMVLAPLTIGLSWLAVRPLLGGLLIGGGVVIGAVMLVLRARKAPAAPGAAPSA
ncbi:uncharacterized protein DUF1625 [Rhodobacter sp. JA431]|uniref:TMEM43 family protein n=1 Tax=Rhodobacter sp. JA431 TaxID=570013 RepID=UPI000BD1C638|nr:TMEM43 family protein [Rhodobacter sp. JA431]SOC12873.1 uncharacterized protein DUF1625 [Rhodobacter sp. JA431]